LPICASATKAYAHCVRNSTRSVLADGLSAMSYRL
jgi:hypothetical protein